MDALKGLPTQTKTGRSIALYANIGQEGDLPGVLEMMPKVSAFSAVSSFISGKRLSNGRRSL